MYRRKFLSSIGIATLAACAPSGRATPAAAAPGPSPPQTPRAVAFDLFTLFDPRGVDRRVREVLGEDQGLSLTWKRKLFEYCWLRASAGQYRDFELLVGDALSHAARAHAVNLTPASRARLEAAFTELEAWPDSASTLDRLRARGLKLAPLANYAPRMIERLLTNAGLRERFAAIISTDRGRTYKPDPRAYALAEATFGLPRQQIAFAAFGGWDAAGARWFGFPTFWVDRLQQPVEELPAADASGSDLLALATWLEAGAQTTPRATSAQKQ